MNKFVINVVHGEKNTAGDKAKKDIVSILEENGFCNINIKIKKSKIYKLFFTYTNVVQSLRNVRSDDIVVAQYPMYSIFTISNLVKVCKRKNISVIAIVHDVESLRLQKSSAKMRKKELKLLNSFDCLIVHNNKMMAKLKKMGINVRMIPLVMFDYKNHNNIVNSNLDNDLVFAGNLKKSSFLEKWSLQKSIRVYGIDPSNEYGEAVRYMGVKAPDDLPRYLDGSFGLVWDGDSVNTNSGVYGEYTKYNNPHKASLYLSCGLPIIVWEKSAIADYVKKNKVGLVVKSLSELPKLLNEVSINDYSEMRSHVLIAAKLIRDGSYTKRAVQRAIDYCKDVKSI